MTIVPVDTNLITYRKRTGLSQEEVALLLGLLSGATICRHETGTIFPTLEAILAYELIFGEPVHGFYEDLSLHVAESVRQRAKDLCNSLESRPANSYRDQKISILKRLIEGNKMSS